MSYSPVPQTMTDEQQHRRRLASAINSATSGKLNAVTTVTLTANAASTTLTDARLTVDSFIGLMPITANAAAALATTYLAAAGRLNGSAVITHANDAQTDKTFTLLIIG